tara:strand:+ start:52 stop:201 length:150 start_codon:yes stop_codon:yes gene_type:complete
MINETAKQEKIKLRPMPLPAVGTFQHFRTADELAAHQAWVEKYKNETPF